MLHFGRFLFQASIGRQVCSVSPVFCYVRTSVEIYFSC